MLILHLYVSLTSYLMSTLIFTRIVFAFMYNIKGGWNSLRHRVIRRDKAFISFISFSSILNSVIVLILVNVRATVYLERLN